MISNTIINKTVVVGMSGGVDSSVSALLLKQQGYHVLGLFMRNWEEENDGVCHAQQDHDDVAAVCSLLDIPHYTINFAQEYRSRVFDSFLEDLRKGYTPNPDILCNREIKFDLFMQKALELGGDYLATGHYCQNLELNQRNHLGRGADGNKDQSYFLYTVSHDKLARTLFPVGHLDKAEVRRLATAHGLPTATKKDSTGICFIGKRDFKEFVSRYIPYSPGNFETPEGRIVGKHDGVAYYTLGQRRGLAIGGEGDAWFVIDKDIQRNAVIVAQGKDHPRLYRTVLSAHTPSWVQGTPPPFSFRCTAKIRYRQPDSPCTVAARAEGELNVTFDMPQKAITPGQSVVFYSGDLCLGGAIISPHNDGIR